MADQAADQQDTTPAQCRPCSGSGKVISNLGGSPTEISCPWCEGTGSFIAEHDAQEHWGTEPASDAPESDTEPA